MRNYFFTLLCLFYFNGVICQDLAPGLKLWSGTGIDWQISKKWSIKYSQLLAFNANPASFQFTQSDLEFLFKQSKLLTIGFGYKPILFYNSPGFNVYNRVYTEFVFRHKLFTLPIKHTITSEYYFPRLPKYRYRFYYSVNYYFKNNFLPFKMTPYIKAEIYYYLNGKRLSYYDDANNLIVKQSPNDFHRYRIGAGITSKPFKFMRATIYYMWQQEFNTKLTKYREINIPNKSQTSTLDPFNNYHVIGIELEFDIQKKQKTHAPKND